MKVSLPLKAYLSIFSIESRMSSRYVFSSPQSASLNPSRDGSFNLFRRADSKQLQLLILFSNLAQVVDRRAFTD